MKVDSIQHGFVIDHIPAGMGLRIHDLLELGDKGLTVALINNVYSKKMGKKDIIKIDAGSSGGGRLAAAKTLSNYGISIKISNDGSMQGFKMDRNKLRARTIFVIG